MQGVALGGDGKAAPRSLPLVPRSSPPLTVAATVVQQRKCALARYAWLRPDRSLPLTSGPFPPWPSFVSVWGRLGFGVGVRPLNVGALLRLVPLFAHEFPAFTSFLHQLLCALSIGRWTGLRTRAAPHFLTRLGHFHSCERTHGRKPRWLLNPWESASDRCLRESGVPKSSTRAREHRPPR